MNVDLRAIVHNKKNDKYFSPATLDDVNIDLVISGAPGRLSCTVARDDLIQIDEGDTVDIYVNDIPFFHGFVFTTKYTKESKIEIIAYDQLRYFKNKDTLIYKNKTATELLTFLANRFQLVVGDVADTKYKIASKIEDDKTLLDMMQYALDTTLVNTKDLYVLYDDFGKLCLKKPIDMQVPILIDNETALNYALESSIDKNTYNLIKLVVEDKKEGVHKEYYAPANVDSANESVKQWGILQYFEKLNKDKQNPQQRANEMLSFYNSAKKRLRIDDAFGDIRVRPGSMIYCSLEIQNTNIAQLMLVTEVRHKFANREHFMDLVVKGGVINDK